MSVVEFNRHPGTKAMFMCLTGILASAKKLLLPVIVGKPISGFRENYGRRKRMNTPKTEHAVRGAGVDGTGMAWHVIF